MSQAQAGSAVRQRSYRTRVTFLNPFAWAVQFENRVADPYWGLNYDRDSGPAQEDEDEEVKICVQGGRFATVS